MLPSRTTSGSAGREGDSPASKRRAVILAAAALAASLVSAIAAADGVAKCAGETGQSVSEFVRRSFDVRELTLYDATRVTLAISKSPCLAHNSVTRVLAYARTPGGTYRQVLDDYGMPESIGATPRGIVTLTSHETMSIMDEATYVWNGTKYVFSPDRSIRYDVEIGAGRSVTDAEQEKPYVVRVRFPAGASSVVLHGSVAGGFGDDYEFDALAGLRVTIDFVKGWSKNLRFDVYQDVPGNGPPRELTLAGGTRTWSAVLPTGGTWRLDVSGSDAMDRTRTSPYTLVFTISPVR